MTARVLILAEGPTEQTFVSNVLGPWLTPRGIHAAARLIRNVRYPSSPDQLGGDVTVNKVINDVGALLRDRHAKLVTTLIDYYGFRLAKNDRRARLSPEQIEARLTEAIDHKRFLPYLQVHEFEALIFSEPSACADHFDMPSLATQIRAIVDKAGNPENIDNRPATTPARRLRKMIPGYRKGIDSVLVLERIGIPKIRERCPRFDSWLSKLEALA